METNYSAGFKEPMKQQSCTCHPGCAACCIAPSISSPIPGMPLGKPAGMRCCQLTYDNRCLLFGKQERPAVCGSLQPSIQMCGANGVEAMAFLTWLEQETVAPPGET
jgi:Fe-S-cluster containining protein